MRNVMTRTWSQGMAAENSAKYNGDISVSIKQMNLHNVN